MYIFRLGDVRILKRSFRSLHFKLNADNYSQNCWSHCNVGCGDAENTGAVREDKVLKRGGGGGEGETGRTEQDAGKRDVRQGLRKRRRGECSVMRRDKDKKEKRSV